MYSLKIVTEKNKEYCFNNMSLESGEYQQEQILVCVKKEGRCSKISVHVEEDRVRSVSHTYSTALRNFNNVIAPDSGRDYFHTIQPVYFWTKNFASRVYDVKSPLYILCGQDNCASLCFGVIGKDYERDFNSLEPHGARALSLYGRTLTLQITGEIPEEYREDVYKEGVYLMDETLDTGIPWTEALREFHEIRQKWEEIVFPYTQKSMYPLWCSWTDWDSADVNEQIVLDNVEEGVKLGIQNYILDDGWFGKGLDCDMSEKLDIGDWESDLSKFPDLRKLTEKIRQKGGQSVIWCAPHAVGDIAKMRSAREKYLVRDAEDKLVYTRNGFNILCMRSPKAREIMADICVHLARDYDTDGAKYDLFNCVPEIECCCKEHSHDTDSMMVGLEKTMELIWKKVRAEKPDYMVELKQNYGGSRLATYGTMMRSGDTPYCPEGNFLRTAYIQSYTPYAVNDYQTITNYDTLASSARVIIKMLAVGIPTYSMDLVALNEDKKQQIRFLNNWYIENIVERENYKRRALDEMLEKWVIEGECENLYFAVNSAEEFMIESGNFQLLNASVKKQLLLHGTGNKRYRMRFYDYTGNLLEERADVSLEESLRIPQEVMLVKGEILDD
ncbi:MAG: alpha-galactosidase [Lachnospiraceae bacterium]|nr:alpha-galactosidase [Lachnospiraceae bacterium]